MSTRFKIVGGFLIAFAALGMLGLFMFATSSDSPDTVQGSTSSPSPSSQPSASPSADPSTSPSADPSASPSADPSTGPSDSSASVDPSTGTGSLPTSAPSTGPGGSADPELDLVDVPDVSGLSVPEAVAKLQRADLQPFEILPNPGSAPGVVEFTTPSFGLQAPEGERVTLYVGDYKKAKTPDVVGLPILEATELVLSRGLQLFAITQAPDGAETLEGDRVSPGNVAAYFDDAKDEGKPATGVSLAVVPEPLAFEVPSLEGMNFALADYFLRAVGLNPKYDPPTSPTAVVTDYSLGSGTPSFGDEVSLTLRNEP